MTHLVPVSRDRHQTKRWRQFADFKFAASTDHVPLMIGELPRAALGMPVGFVPAGDSFIPAALLGLTRDQNLLVDGAGRWLISYVPLALRSYPFTLVSTADGREVLCVDEDSGLITDGPEGERFLDENGEPSSAMATIMAFLQQASAHGKTTRRVCAVLNEHGLIRPWNIVVAMPSGEQKVEGLRCIDEAALGKLPAEAFLAVRDAGGLPVAYCQLISMAHVKVLGEAAAARAALAARWLPVNKAGELDLEFLNDGPMLDFGRLK